MVRKGKITFIEEHKSGVITDENEQEISFPLKDFASEFKIGMDIFFQIELTSIGLVVCFIEPILA